MSKEKYINLSAEDLMELEDEPICHNCEHCLYIAEGDHLCDEHQEFVLDGWEPTLKFLCCDGKDFVRN